MKTIVLLAAVGSFCTLVSCQAPSSSEPQRPMGVTEVHSGADAETRDIAQRELARRQQALRDARELLNEGKRKYADGDLEGAVQSYKRSIDLHP